MRILVSVMLMLFVVATATVATSAQMCGMSFVKVIVYDTNAQPIKESSFELLGSVSADKFKELSAKYGDPQHSAVALPTETGVELANGPLTKLSGKDGCGNAFKQTDGTTTAKEYRNQPASKENFGICMSEGGTLGPVLAKVSAPGFETGYFLTESFVGCGHRASFTLRRR
jgi:hypothetical protein